MIAPSYKKNAKLISVEGEREEKQRKRREADRESTERLADLCGVRPKDSL